MTLPTGAPGPTVVDGRRVVDVDVETVDVELRFDVATATATGRATVGLRADEAGFAALDLRQEISALSLDGVALPVGAFAPVDLGGGPGAEMRVLDVALDAGSQHVLGVEYALATPDTVGAEPVGWRPDGVRFDLWMSDLHPGRYLEMWIPAPLCHDRFALRVDLAVTGTAIPHTVVTNAGPGQADLGANRWRIAYPGSFTSLSPMLVLAPSDEVEQRFSTVELPGRGAPLGLRCARHVDVDADLGATEADIRSWLTYLASRYGPWAHGDEFTAFVWGPGRGMEYDGATTASVAAMEHEVFHSWFGRGVKPARASDGWIDEAYTTWSTVSGRSPLARFAELAFDPEAPPVLLCPPHPWSRYTPTASYGDGARLFAGIAAGIGGADRLRSAMADWYRANRGGLVTTDGLGAHLSAWSGVDLSPWWRRFVHGLA